MSGSVHPRNTNNFWLLGLTDEATGLPINDATVTWYIRTAAYPDGSQVATGSGAYVAGSDGDYRCDVDAAEALTAGTKYWRRVVATKSGVGTFDAEEEFVAKRRTGSTPTT